MNTALLMRDNPDLLRLESDYHDFMLANGLEHSLWQKHQENINLADFRSDGNYVGQLPDEAAYRATFDHVRSIDAEGYLDRLKEDRLFGIRAFDFDGVTVSRDLLDSILEIYFLKETLGWQNDDAPRLLDIGAGYGRFAHRFTSAFENGRIICTDAVAVSTFLCDFYLEYRGCGSGVFDPAIVLPFTEIAETSMTTATELAVNIHSWSECSLGAINWWLDRLADWNVPYLFVVPHDARFVAVNADGSIGNFRPTIEAHGYKLVRLRTKFDPMIDGLYPETIYTLWERG